MPAAPYNQVMPDPMPDPRPVLYSFRRCPYAMRARMALRYAGIRCELREVELRDKPVEMLTASAKGTVPVLLLPDSDGAGEVIDESLDVMLWALAQHDSEGWLDVDTDLASQLIDANDNNFKVWLDRYKYPNRYAGSEAEAVDKAACDRVSPRAEGERFLQALEGRLAKGGQLMGAQRSFVDVAIFPFVRQFAFVDFDWFRESRYQAVNRWLSSHLDSTLFADVMHKYPQWRAGQAGVLF
jgi:glutathione S-transferase